MYIVFCCFFLMQSPGRLFSAGAAPIFHGGSCWSSRHSSCRTDQIQVSMHGLETVVDMCRDRRTISQRTRVAGASRPRLAASRPSAGGLLCSSVSRAITFGWGLHAVLASRWLRSVLASRARRWHGEEEDRSDRAGHDRPHEELVVLTHPHGGVLAAVESQQPGGWTLAQNPSGEGIYMGSFDLGWSGSTIWPERVEWEHWLVRAQGTHTESLLASASLFFW
jgi:hypothetical protein